MFLNGLHGKPFFHAHFFKNLSAIFGKTRLSGFVGSRGGNIRSFTAGAERELSEQDSTEVP